MQLFVRLLDNKLVVIDTSPDETIDDVKGKVVARMEPSSLYPGPPTPEQGTFELTKKTYGQRLAGNLTVSDHDIVNEQTLRLTFFKASII